MSDSISESTQKISSVSGLLLNGVSHVWKVTKDAVVKNYGLVVSYWTGTAKFIATRSWFTKPFWAILLIIVGIAWSLVLMIVAVITPFMPPLGVAIVVGMILITIDQATYPTNLVNPSFALESNKDITLDQKGAVLLAASYHQIEKELNSFLGWCPNDVWINPFAHLDNRCMRQVGVWYATATATKTLSESITKFGIGAQEHPKTKNARLHFAQFATQWGWMGLLSDASENHFKLAIEDMTSFQHEANRSDSTATEELLINIRADDFVRILAMIVEDWGILSEPYGGLTLRNAKVVWSKLDDNVYYAQGAAIVARDIAVGLKYTFPEQLSRGGMENLNAAIDALDAAALYNPPWISRGDSKDLVWSKFADDRAKMQSYFTVAFRRIEDLKESLEN